MCEGGRVYKYVYIVEKGTPSIIDTNIWNGKRRRSGGCQGATRGVPFRYPYTSYFIPLGPDRYTKSKHAIPQSTGSTCLETSLLGSSTAWSAPARKDLVLGGEELKSNDARWRLDIQALS